MKNNYFHAKKQVLSEAILDHDSLGTCTAVLTNENIQLAKVIEIKEKAKHLSKFSGDGNKGSSTRVTMKLASFVRNTFSLEFSLPIARHQSVNYVIRASTCCASPEKQ